MLIYFKKKDKFSDFKNEDLKDYFKFRNVLMKFKKFYDIDKYNLRDIDKYLWIAGKEYFPKRYYKKVLRKRIRKFKKCVT